MAKNKDLMIFNKMQTSNAEMLVLEGVCLVNASADKKPLFQRVKIMNEDRLICKN